MVDPILCFTCDGLGHSEVADKGLVLRGAFASVAGFRTASVTSARPGLCRGGLRSFGSGVHGGFLLPLFKTLDVYIEKGPPQRRSTKEPSLAMYGQ